MGYRAWRQRQSDRFDALADRLDEKAKKLESDEAERRAERERRRADAEAAALDAWYRSRAEMLNEDHDDLARRGEALGLVLPKPPKRRGSTVAALGALVTLEDSGGDGGRKVDSYEAWRDRIVVEEACAAKLARGERLSMLDRVGLRAARLAYR